MSEEEQESREEETDTQEVRREGTTQKSWLVTLLLAILVGHLGIDRFYLGKIGTGVLKLITFGGLGLWWLIDVILIAMDKMEDSDGRQLRHPEI